MRRLLRVGVLAVFRMSTGANPLRRLVSGVLLILISSELQNVHMSWAMPRGLVRSSKESKLSSVALPVMIQRTTCVSCAAMYRRELSVHLAPDSQGFPSSL
ncbi:hypothetical protein EV421DRAFT_1762377 [Armillaria borealis]|uniref:Uncharacterized protein n=1 Tax=Armillaria borealis TaxID=47425 RepID=A0AA39K4S0_9AGAR|nr:hypothetical protein EV421DRAFT_1762377 [Armillaria borealis]